MTEHNSRLFRLGLFVLCHYVLLLHLKCACLLLLINIILTCDLRLESLFCLTLVTFSLGNAALSPDPRATFLQPLPLTSEFSEHVPPWFSGNKSLAFGPGVPWTRAMERHGEMLPLTASLGFSRENLRQKKKKSSGFILFA